jgi:hypothetical protein
MKDRSIQVRKAAEEALSNINLVAQ